MQSYAVDDRARQAPARTPQARPPGSALGDAAQRANAGPHAASLAGLRSVMAGRTAVQRTAVTRPSVDAAPPVQRNGDEDETSDASGKQEDIQRKMATLVGMCRLQDDPDAEETDWERDVRTNGLCGGWVQVFKKYPEWTTELWAAMKDWEVPDDPDPDDHDELLDSLNSLIATYATRASGIRNAGGRQAFMQVVQLLREAWREMAALEPHNYDEAAPPEFTEGIADARGEPAEIKLVWEKTIREKRGADGAAVTARAIQQFVEGKQAKRPQQQFTAHIETDLHHMAVRVRTTSTRTDITVVETENLGIETLDSWDQLARHLAGGFFLDDRKTEEVEIRIYAPE
jgi:hypothetical protein